VRPEDQVELEARSAVHELGAGLDRHEAEERAYADYVAHRSSAAAAHHLAGMRAAHAAGDVGAAARHGLLYGVYMRSLGHNPNGEPPPEVAAASRSPRTARVYAFAPHSADEVALEFLRDRGVGGLAKAEPVAAFGALVGSDHGIEEWDLSHLLSEARRLAGERLHVREAGRARTAHHFRLDGDRRLPLASLLQREDGLAEPVNDRSAGASNDVVEAANAAFRARSAASSARLASSAKAALGAVEAARSTLG
jgi:hypothetical protein